MWKLLRLLLAREQQRVSGRKRNRYVHHRPHPAGKSSRVKTLDTRIRCRRCHRKTMVLERRAFLAGSGVRGYYACYNCRHFVVLVRSGVTRQISRNRRKIYYV